MSFFNNWAAVSLMVLIILIISAAVVFRNRIKSIFSNDNKSQVNDYPNNVQVTEATETCYDGIEISSGELRLIGVDERTAAIIIATVCDHLKTPLNELQFKSIKALD